MPAGTASSKPKQSRSSNGASAVNSNGIAAAAAAKNGRLPIQEVDAAPVPPESAPATATALMRPDGGAIDPREVAEGLEGRSAEETIAWALDTFGPGLSFACSFQKTTSMVVDIVHRLGAEARFFYLDTGVLFDESYATRDALEERYGIEFERHAGISLEEQAELYGDSLWARQPDACCGIRKVEPMREALEAVECWVSGIRRADSRTRAGAAKFGWDRRFGLWKLNPLADLSDQEVWAYLMKHDVPYNPLHDAGYPSIGCTHCTRPPGAGEAPRAGRWADAEKTECGLHG
ncbi:MAG: phosphoadenylyl-sulfate reductase [Solirubrobacterales bacterium]